jgi:hypothetical protein
MRPTGLHATTSVEVPCLGSFLKEARIAYPSVLGCFLLRVKEFPVHCYSNGIYVVIKSAAREESRLVNTQFLLLQSFFHRPYLKRAFRILNAIKKTPWFLVR